MKKPLAFVLGGGGARGALQVGALRALYEAGYRPDMMVGTSAGAVNATYLALRGFDERGLDQLEQAWLEAAWDDLLPPNYLQLALRYLLKANGYLFSPHTRVFYHPGLSQSCAEI
jgi:NTE family protein